MEEGDVEKTHTKEEFLSKLKRPADCIEKKMRILRFLLQARLFMFLTVVQRFPFSTNAQRARMSSSFRQEFLLQFD